MLLPALMLGRVDGKSPVEYLSEQNRQIVRNIARRFIQHPTDKLEALVMAIQESLKESQT